MSEVETIPAVDNDFSSQLKAFWEGLGAFCEYECRYYKLTITGLNVTR